MNFENEEIAYFAGGCFWCIQALFKRVPGVKRTIAGYMGGETQHPSYEEVCTGTTGHAEVVQIVYDPKQVHYDDLLDIFFSLHDPTTLNRQGDDIGTQYRSSIFYLNKAQKIAAENKIQLLSQKKEYANPIVTEVIQANAFYPAENYHQEYFDNNPSTSFCQYVILPKIEHLNEILQEKKVNP